MAEDLAQLGAQVLSHLLRIGEPVAPRRLSQVLHDACRRVDPDVRLDQQLLQVVVQLVVDLAAAGDELIDLLE